MRDVIVLCHHAVSSDWPAVLAVSPERFAEQVEVLARRGYQGVTFAEALEGPRRRKAVAITFDDAFASVLEHAYPVLHDAGMPGTIFAVTDFAESGRPLAWEGTDRWLDGPHDAELAGLGWDELRGLADAGWEIGSHTKTHPRLTRLGDAELERELRESREACEAALGGPCASVAYPYGDVDARVLAAAAAAGYRHGAGLPPHRRLPRPLDFPRIGVYRADDLRRFRLKISRPVRAARLVLRR